MAVQDFFTWGAGGQKLTPDQLARRREIEDALVARGPDFSPVGHWTQGLARVADAAAGAFRRNRLGKAEGENAEINKGLIANLLAGGSGAASPSSSASIPMPGAAGEIAATSPSAQPIDLSGNEVYSQFIGAAREGGLTNPYGLAALAATGKAESGFSPGNVNRTWSDPSQSGQPGTAGGILSWRGPRYQALAATGDLSPAGQARFFLQEDPGLVQALNSAKSVEEAQGLINNAWKFAGYDRADGETARRLGLARSFLPTFQGGGEVAAATPEAAIEAIAPLQPVERAPLPSMSYAGQERAAPVSLSEEVSAYQQTPEYAAAFPGRAQPAQAAAPVQVAGGGDRVPMTGNTGINPAIIDALTNPQASPQTQRLAALLMEQEQARQKALLDRSKPIEVNGRIVNPITGQVIADYSDPKTATVGNSVIDLRTGKPIYEGPQDPKTVTVGNTIVDLRTNQPVYQGQPEATTGMREYDAYAADEKAAGRTPIGRLEYEQAIKKAGANSTTNIVGGEGDKFYENLDKKNAETFATLSDSGMQARGKMVQIDRLEALLSQSPQGYEAGIKQWLGDLGVQTEGLDALQSTRALLEKMVPAQRPPGSGPMSDADIVMFRNSLPRLINQPGGNELILQTMRGIAQYEMQMGEIADLVADRAQLADGTKVTPSVGRQMIRDLQNPLDGLNKLIKQSGTAAATSVPNVVPTDIPGVTIRRKN